MDGSGRKAEDVMDEIRDLCRILEGHADSEAGPDHRDTVDRVHLLTAISEQVTDAVIATDLQFRITYVNAAFEKLYGYRRDELLGQSPAVLNARDDSERIQDDIYETVSRAEIWRGDVENRRKDGSTFTCELTVFPLKDEGGRIFAYASTLRDVTQHRAAEMKNLLSRFSVDNSNEIMAWIGSDARFVRVNGACCRALGYSFDELKSMTVHDIDPNFPKDRWPDYWRELKEKRVLEFETVHRRKDGTIFPVELRLAYLEFGGTEYNFVIAHDISDRRQAEQKLLYRLEFEKVIADVSAKLISVSGDELDEGISEALGRIGRFAGVDRSYVFQFHDDGNTVDNTHEWCADGIESQIANLKGIDLKGELPFFAQRMHRQEAFHVPSVEDMAPEASAEKQHFAEQGIQSLLALPMTYAGRLKGFVGFDTVAQPKTWSENEISLLRSMAHVFVGALVRSSSENALRRSEEKLRLAMEATTDGLWDWNLVTGDVYYSRAWYRILGADTSGDDYESWASRLHPDDRDSVLAAIDEHLAGKTDIYRSEYRLRTDSGDWKWVIGRGRVIEHDSRGSALRMIGTLSDISDRKQAEEALLWEKKLLEDVTASVQCGLMLLDADARILYGNKLIEEWFGPVDSIKGKSCCSAMHMDMSQCPAREVALTGQNVQAQTLLRKVDGQERFFQVAASPIKDEDGKVTQITQVLVDITDHRRAQEEIDNATHRLSESIENMMDGYALHEAVFDDSGRMVDFRYIEFNPAAQRIVGLSREQIIGGKATDLFPGIVERGLMGRYADVVATGEPAFIEDFYYEGDDLNKAFDISCYRVDESHFVCVFRDVTESKKFEIAFKAEKEFTDNAINAQLDTFFVFDPLTGRAIRWNETFSRISGYTDQEIASMKAPDSYYDADDVNRARAELAGPSTTDSLTIELSLITKSGKRIPFEYRVSFVETADGQSIAISIGRDITERKRVAEQLRQRQAELAHVSRVNTMGQMASGLAHELNQPLAAILNYAGACLRMAKGNEDVPAKIIDALGEISSQTERAGAIIRRLRAMVRKGGSLQSAVPINDVVQEVLKIQDAEAMRRNIVVHTELADDLPPASGDLVQIEQVVLNLVGNAIDAMDAVESDSRQLTIRTSALDAETIVVAVSDTGTGLAPGVEEKVFDSFFTTKEKGLGVGLSLSRSIIESHGGKLWAENNPDGGATFRFTLGVYE